LLRRRFSSLVDVVFPVGHGPIEVLERQLAGLLQQKRLGVTELGTSRRSGQPAGVIGGDRPVGERKLGAGHLAQRPGELHGAAGFAAVHAAAVPQRGPG
jgi:hypothetical protein